MRNNKREITEPFKTTTVMRLEEKYSPKAGVGKHKAVGKWALTNLGILNIIHISYKG